MTTRTVLDKMATVPDPNKQTFPIIQNPTQFFTVPNCPSPTKTAESVTLSMKQPSIQLPELIHTGGSGDHKERSEQTATGASFPKVKRNLTMKKTASSNVKSYKNADKFGQAEAIPYQCQSFRSTTKVKVVPITKRNRDMFSAAARSKPGPIAKTKSVSFYTKPFLWQGQQSTDQAESTNLPTRFLEEEENLRKVRGQKRKHGVPSHRQWFNDLHVGGKSTNIAEKYDYRDEADKIRQLALPPNAQELYMGRGINLPEDHSTNRRMKEWQNKIKAECELPNSAPAMTTVMTSAVKTTMQSTIPRYIQPLPKVTRSHTMSHSTSDRHSSIASEPSSVRKPGRRKSQMERQRRNSEISRRGSQVELKKQETKGVEPEPLKSEAVTLSEDNEMEMEVKDDAIDNSTPVEVAMEETKDEGEISITADVRPNSEMEIEIPEDDPSRLGLHHSSSFSKIASPNPLTSIDITLHISADRKEELSAKFTKLDSNRDGHITFQELMSVLPDSITKSQKKFIKEVYEAVSSSTFFGLEEFVGVTCLGELMTKLPVPIKDYYDDVDFASIQQTIMKYVMMFSSVDRQQTGAISVDSLLEVLSMATDRDLKSDQSQTEQILATIAKNASSTIDKIEYLAYLPFFLQCR